MFFHHKDSGLSALGGASAVGGLGIGPPSLASFPKSQVLFYHPHPCNPALAPADMASIGRTPGYYGLSDDLSMLEPLVTEFPGAKKELFGLEASIAVPSLETIGPPT